MCGCPWLSGRKTRGLRHLTRKLRMKDSAGIFEEIGALDRIHGDVGVGKVSRILHGTLGVKLIRRDPPADPADACMSLEPRPPAGGPGTSVALDEPSATCEVTAATLMALLDQCRPESSERESKAGPSRRAPVPIAARVRWRSCSLSQSTRRRTRDSAPARPPATARGAAGIARWHQRAPQAWERSPLLRCERCFSLGFA